MSNTDEETTHIDVSSLEEHIGEVIERYRDEYGYLSGTGMDNRDAFNLKKRLTASISSKLEEMDNDYVEHLEEKVQEMEERLTLAEDPQFQQLYQEYDAMKAVVKELLYRLGSEDSVTVIPNEQLRYKADHVSLDIDPDGTSTKLEVVEHD